MDALPVIDLTAVDESSAAAQIDHACRTSGFFLLAGHDVAETGLNALDAAARRFFALDDDQKAAIAMANAGLAWRGWFPEGGELTAGRADLKEGLYFGRELPADDPRVLAGTPLHGPNQFPAEPTELAPAVQAWMDQMTALGHRVARLLALGIGLPATWFDRHLTADPTVLFRIFRYPPRVAEESEDAEESDDGEWGVAEHTDYGLLTILAHDGTAGLEVHTGGRWVEVPVIDGAFVVNLGDMLERMTAGRYRSTPHRVRPPAAGQQARLSFPFFFDPAWDAEILPVPPGTFADDDRPGAAGSAATERARWDGASVHDWSGTYGDYLTAKVAKVFPALGRQVLGGEAP